MGAFGWHVLAQTTAARPFPGGAPLFVRIGRLLARSNRGGAFVRRLVREEPAAHILGYVLIGVAGQPALSETLRDHVRDLASHLLERREGVALGHALELASVLQQAGLGVEAERYARRVFAIGERFQPHERQPYEDSAYAILAGALAQRGLWEEVLEIPEKRGHTPTVLFMLNIRAVAIMETRRRLADAKLLLDTVLSVQPDNPMALANLTSYWLRCKNWQQTLDAAAHAAKVLSGADLDGVLLNEALARFNLGDGHAAAVTLERMTPEGRARPEADDIRRRLDGGNVAQAGAGATALKGAEGALIVGALAGTREAQEPFAPPPSRPASPQTDIAIVTVLPEEYEAVVHRIAGAQLVPSLPLLPNAYGWTTGTIARKDGAGIYRVVVALVGRANNLSSQPVVLRTIDRWAPRYVVVSGIAGGLKRDGLVQGDVVVSDAVWYYEYGKLKQRFQARIRDLFRADAALCRSAVAYKAINHDWKACGKAAPVPDHEPKCVFGVVGSGEKVIDDLDHEYMKDVLAVCPQLVAVEMEGAGAAAAVQDAEANGCHVGFIMVRGISDSPPDAQAVAGSAPLDQTVQRDAWKKFASAVAASFLISWVAAAWPTAPAS